MRDSGQTGTVECASCIRNVRFSSASSRRRASRSSSSGESVRPTAPNEELWNEVDLIESCIAREEFLGWGSTGINYDVYAIAFSI